MPRVVVVGSANVDFVVQTPHIPRPGETVLGQRFVMAMGGKGANQAVGAARLGADVVFVARVGRDIFGDQCVEAYHGEGINTGYITRDDQEATGVALIAVAADGENSITVASGANMHLLPEHITAAEEAIARADVLVMQLEVPVETVLAAARIAREHDVRVVLNPAPARALPGDLLRLVDVLTPNRIELAQLAGLSEGQVRQLSEEQLGQVLLGLGVKQGVITLGAQGALIADSAGVVHVPAFPVTVQDTTAAGDAFNAGLAVALARGRALVGAARFASACGALAATKMGAQPSLPTEIAVEAFLAGQ
ncbi:MAG: ribokinase [Anaerolineae bacterium]|nr:ribokinase [Anaerolineae bacterium]